MYKQIKDAVIGCYNGSAIFFATDYALTIKHNIRTKNQMRKEKIKMDSVTYEMEYLNLMQGGSENQYYSLDLVASAQKIKKAWYPKTQDEYFENKKTRFGDIKKHNNEVRVVSMDIAISATTKRSVNDATVIKCVRAIQNGEKYERQEVYTESFEGVDIDTQAIRVHQLLNDFEADYFVFDYLE